MLDYIYFYIVSIVYRLGFVKTLIGLGSLAMKTNKRWYEHFIIFPSEFLLVLLSSYTYMYFIIPLANTHLSYNYNMDLAFKDFFNGLAKIFRSSPVLSRILNI